LGHTYGKAEVPPKNGNSIPTGCRITGGSFETSAPTSVRRGLGTTRPETVAEVMNRDKPEAVETFPLPARQEIPQEPLK